MWVCVCVFLFFLLHIHIQAEERKQESSFLLCITKPQNILRSPTRGYSLKPKSVIHDTGGLKSNFHRQKSTMFPRLSSLISSQFLVDTDRFIQLTTFFFYTVLVLSVCFCQSVDLLTLLETWNTCSICFVTKKNLEHASFRTLYVHK